MRCVLVSKTLNLRAYLASEISGLDGYVSFVDHPDADGATEVRMAVAWNPPADAFDPYPNNSRPRCEVAGPFLIRNRHELPTSQTRGSSTIQPGTS